MSYGSGWRKDAANKSLSLVTQVRTRTARIRVELVRRTRWPAPVITRVDCAAVPPAGDAVFLRRPAAVRLLLLLLLMMMM